MSNTNKLKAITNAAKQIRKAKPNIKWTDAIKEASKKISGNYKPAAKKQAAKKPVIKTHKDTNSHNVNIRVMSGAGESITFHRVNNNVNGNPRYAIHFLEILNDEEYSFLPWTKKYEYSLKKARLLGGKKYDNKNFGGGIVFESYNTIALEKKLLELKHKTPKIKI